MTNIEKYEKEICKLVNEGSSIECAIATVSGKRKEKPCVFEDCSECANKCLEWMYAEYNEQILTDEEKEIIKEMLDVLLKLGCEVEYLIKNDDGYGKCYILFSYSNKLTGYSDCMTTPWFKKDKFKGMETCKKYTIEELGIELEKRHEEWSEIRKRNSANAESRLL